MRPFALLLLLSFVGFPLLSACAQQATSSAQQAKPKKLSKKEATQQARANAAKAAQQTGPVLTFERTECLGRCPAYKMQVYADGRVAYEGHRAVPLLGAQEMKLPAATVAAMLRNAREAKFEQFQERYAQFTSDLPSVVVGVRQANGQLKTVTVEEGAPADVQRLFAYFSSQFDQLAQLGGVDR